MGGSNPYIELSAIEKPTKKYKIRFEPMGIEVEVDPAKIPMGETGLPGSILDIAIHSGVQIDRACGGVAACSTCHVFVQKGLSSCNEAQDFELDRIDAAPGNNEQSRLSCQCVANGKEDLVVEVPEWNRNLVQESH